MINGIAVRFHHGRYAVNKERRSAEKRSGFTPQPKPPGCKPLKCMHIKNIKKLLAIMIVASIAIDRKSVV